MSEGNTTSGKGWRLFGGDCRETLAALPEQSVHCCVTSPPYFGLRDYGTATWDGGHADCGHIAPALGGTGKETLVGTTAAGNGTRLQQYRETCGKCGATRKDAQIGLEQTPAAYVAELVGVFREVRRVLRDDGAVWINLGDSYANDAKWGGSSGGKHVAALHGQTGIGRAKNETGLPAKNLIGIPWRVAFALQDDGWILRSDIIWAKPNPMPESVTDRPTKAHEYVFLLTKSPTYFYDAQAIAEPVAPGNEGSTTGFYPSRAVAMGLQASGNEAKPIKQQPTRAATRNKRSVWSIPGECFSERFASVRQVAVAKDAVSGDTIRTPSAGCPAHASWDCLRPIPEGGERIDACPFHSHGNDARLVPELSGGSVPTAPNPDEDLPEQNSGSRSPSCSVPATPHNKETRKTAPVPATTPPCTPSAQKAVRIGDTPGLFGSDEPAPNTPANSSEGSDPASRPSSQTSYRTSHTSGQTGISGPFSVPFECICSFYTEKHEETSHFAVMPTALVKPCVRAGCPAGGTVLDPFAGSGTTGIVAVAEGRQFVGCELNREYMALAARRLTRAALQERLEL